MISLVGRSNAQTQETRNHLYHTLTSSTCRSATSPCSLALPFWRHPSQHHPHVQCRYATHIHVPACIYGFVCPACTTSVCIRCHSAPWFIDSHPHAHNALIQIAFHDTSSPSAFFNACLSLRLPHRLGLGAVARCHDANARAESDEFGLVGELEVSFGRGVRC